MRRRRETGSWFNKSPRWSGSNIHHVPGCCLQRWDCQAAVIFKTREIFQSSPSLSSTCSLFRPTGLKTSQSHEPITAVCPVWGEFEVWESPIQSWRVTCHMFHCSDWLEASTAQTVEPKTQILFKSFHKHVCFLFISNLSVCMRRQPFCLFCLKSDKPRPQVSWV